MPPIRVYLDSCDYSDLSNPRVLQQSPIKQSVLHFLRECVASQYIEIVFSAVTVSELIHLQDSAKEHAIRRAGLLEALTNGRALVPPHVLFKAEALNLAAAKEAVLEEHDLYSDDWCWMPFKSTISQEIEGFRELSIKQAKEGLIKHGLPRAERKRLEKKMFNRGRITDEWAKKMLSDQGEVVLEKNNSEIRLTDLCTKEELVALLKGDKDEEAIMRRMFANMMSPSMLIRKFCEYEPSLRVIVSELFRKQGVKFPLAIETLRQKIAEKACDLETKDYDAIKRQFPLFTKQAIEQVRRSQLQDLRDAEVDEAQWSERVLSSPIGHLRGLDMMMLVSEAMILKYAKDPNQKASHSDWADLNNVAYMPYVDVIRLDKRLANLVDELKRSHGYDGATCVKRLEDLPPTIIKLCPDSGRYWSVT